MNWDFTLYAVPLLMSAVMLLLIANIAWRRRTLPGALYLLVLCLTILIYVLGYTLELGSTSVHAVSIWLKVEYLGVPTAPAMLFLLTLSYTQPTRHLSSRFKAVLLIIPFLTMIVAWTNELHEWIWGGIALDRSHGYTGTVFVRGWWGWWVMLPYIYAFTIGSGILLARSVATSSGIYRRQGLIMLIGTIIPLSFHAAWIAGLTPPHLDTTPYGLSATALLLGVGMFHFQLFNVLPLAASAVMAGLDDLVIVIDTLNRVVDLNPAAWDTVRNPAHVIGQPISDVFPDQRAIIEQYMHESHAETEIVVGSSDDRRVYEMHLSTLTWHNWQPVGRLIVLHNITQRKLVETERERLLVEMDAFTHTVAHDLKNPLSVLGGYCMLVQEEYASMTDDEVLEYLGLIINYSHKMTYIINELLLLAGVRQMKEVHIAPLDMAEIIAEARTRLLILIRDSDAQIILPDSWPVARGYSPWIEEVWTNYLSNAIKYGGTPPRIQVGATEQADGTVRFWVRDNGAGLSPEERTQLFAPFTRLSSIRAKGHGLGLSIVRRIVERLDGTVGVDSEVGSGSVFWFTLPGTGQKP